MKTDYTITKAVADVFEELPDTFHATDLINGVRVKLIRNNFELRRPFDSTILRTLRRLRARDYDHFGWKCIDNKEAIYRKTIKK